MARTIVTAVLGFAVSSLDRASANAVETRRTAGAGTVAPARGPAVAPVFKTILVQLRRKTKVPVRLPARLPDLGQGTERIYAVIVNAVSSGYQIVLDFTPDCGGETPCRLATLSATQHATKQTGESVRLARGITGYFNEASIGANVSDGTLTWCQQGVQYSVGIKAGDVKEVVELANAVIQSGHGETQKMLECVGAC